MVVSVRSSLADEGVLSTERGVTGKYAGGGGVMISGGGGNKKRVHRRHAGGGPTGSPTCLIMLGGDSGHNVSSNRMYVCTVNVLDHAQQPHTLAFFPLSDRTQKQQCTTMHTVYRNVPTQYAFIGMSHTRRGTAATVVRYDSYSMCSPPCLWPPYTYTHMQYVYHAA